jgi:hypothetical protein
MFVGEFRNAWRYSSWTDRIDMMSDISGGQRDLCHLMG